MLRTTPAMAAGVPDRRLWMRRKKSEDEVNVATSFQLCRYVRGLDRSCKQRPALRPN